MAKKIQPMLSELSTEKLVSLIKSTPAGTVLSYKAVQELNQRAQRKLEERQTTSVVASTEPTQPATHGRLERFPIYSSKRGNRLRKLHRPSFVNESPLPTD